MRDWIPYIGCLTLAILAPPLAHSDSRLAPLLSPSLPGSIACSAPCVAALAIASKGLTQNIVPVAGKNLLLAGGHQFHDLWVRDFAMSVGGLLALGREDVVHDTLELILGLQRADGLLPRVVDNHDITERTILGSAFGDVQDFAEPLQGWFETENHVLVIDGNVTIPWAASRYLHATRDMAFARRWFGAMERSLEFLESNYGVDGLIGRQPAFSDWEDSVSRTGIVALTNEFYLLALQGAAEWADLIGDHDQASVYQIRAMQVRAAFLKQFWDPFQGRLINFVGDDHWTADANFMAVAFDLVPDEAAMTILSHWPDQISHPWPRTTWPDYPDSSKDEIVKLVGIADYHDKLYWIWLGAAAAMAERATGDCQSYNSLIDTMSETVTINGAVHEIYELSADTQQLKPVSRLLYHAEAPFSWSSAMLIEAMSGGCSQRR